MKAVEQSTTKYEIHYQVALLFKNENANMLNNRKQLMQRIMFLEGSFKKDPKLFEDYKKFISTFLVKKHLRRQDYLPVRKT